MIDGKQRRGTGEGTKGRGEAAHREGGYRGGRRQEEAKRIGVS